MQNKLMKLYTECTKEGNKNKKKINSWVEVKNPLKWETLDFLITIQLHKTPVEESTIIKMTWMIKKNKIVQHWSWMLIWVIRLTELPFTDRMKIIWLKLPNNLQRNTTWIKKANKNFCNFLKFSWVMFCRKSIKMKRVDKKNTILINRID